MKHIKYFLQTLLLFILSNALKAQEVPVMKEPHHKPVLVNNYVRLLDVHINTKDTTQYHIHAAPSVIVILSNSAIGSQKKGEAPVTPNNVVAGQTSYVDYGANPITHRVFNAGNNVFHVMDIELARSSFVTDSCASMQQNNVETTINEKLVKVFKFDVAAHQSFNLQKTTCAHLLVCISGEITASNKKIKAGEYIFFNPNITSVLNNQETEKADCVLLELK